MIKSNRSKRRKTQEELRTIYNIYSNTNNNTYVRENNDNMYSTNPESLQIPLCETDNLSSLQLPSNNQHFNCIQQVTNYSSTSPNESINNISAVYLENNQNSHSFREELNSWAVQCNVPHATIDKLLKLMKQHKNINTTDLPLDSRTLLKTPRSISINNNVRSRSVHPGQYSHFGLTAGILRYALPSLSEIKISIGIDGLPLAKSSNAQLWPILAYIIDMPKFVFPVGIYYGNSKPNNSDDFLADFISEATNLLKNGIIINNVSKKVTINMFVCDAPAKSFILKIKGHSGFSSCTRCIQEGEYYQNRVCFPYSELKCIERTHNGYINMAYEEHHIGLTTSRLVELPGIDLVHTFPLDYMHLVCLGVVRKLILLWLHKGPMHTRLPGLTVKKLSASLLAVKSFIPSDFVRKTRDIQEIGRWKATELRLFLLYVGPVVLKNIVPKDVYTNFMALHTSMVILLSPNLQSYVNYAKDLLEYFVKTFQFIYGQEHVSHNVHGLLHICEDYKYFGPLDNCSAFIFENYMKELKSKIRKHEKPLQQLTNRYTEIYNQEHFNSSNDLPQQTILSKPHNSGPLIGNIQGLQYKKIKLNQIKLNIKTDIESYILTKNGEVVKIFNIVQCKNKKILLIGKKFEKITPCYEKPVNSKLFDIYTVYNLLEELECWNDNEVKKKMMVIIHENISVAIPIIHTEV